MKDKDEKALQFMRSYIDEKGYAPNFVEIMEAIDERSKAGITRVINRLAQSGRISRVPGVARSIRVLDCTPMVDSNN
jgi:SOS-response transcriptional repressor LexA